MMRTTTVVMISLLILGLGCSNLRVSSDWDPEIDYSKISTYAWIGQGTGVEGTVEASALLDDRIRRATGEALLAKGISEVSHEQADILVSYHIGIEVKLDVQTIHRGYGYGYGYGGYGRYPSYGGGGYTDTRVTEYEEGTFLLDMIDPEKMQLIWRGSAQSRISQKTSPEEREQRVREVVDKVLAQYPPSK